MRVAPDITSSPDCPWGQPLVWGFGWASSIVVKDAMATVARTRSHYEVSGRMVACKACDGYHVIFDQDDRPFEERRERFAWRSKSWD